MNMNTKFQNQVETLINEEIADFHKYWVWHLPDRIKDFAIVLSDPDQLQQWVATKICNELNDRSLYFGELNTAVMVALSSLDWNDLCAKFRQQSQSLHKLHKRAIAFHGYLERRSISCLCPSFLKWKERFEQDCLVNL